MAVVQICSQIFYKDHALSVSKRLREKDRAISGVCVGNREDCSCFSSVSRDSGSRWHASYHANDFSMKTKTRLDNACYMVSYRRLMPIQTNIEVSALYWVYNMESEHKAARQGGSQKENLCKFSNASESSRRENHLKILDSYFSKLQHEQSQQQTTSMCSSDFETVVEENKMEPLSKSPDKTMEPLGQNDQFDPKEELGTLAHKLNREANPQKNITSSHDGEDTEDNLVRTPYVDIEDNDRIDERKLDPDMQFVTKDDLSNSDSSHGQQPYDETSDLYLIGTLASINIAVFIFEMASPVQYSDVELLSLPLLYGAKINQLILVGEWWRLVTPMFLHSGFLHVALGCWVLRTFGPQVCRGYGSFTFFFIYVLGGISGNLTSFIHTPELTVGGTGPTFAMIGAWMIYQIQNKDAIAKEVSESMFRKAVIATALSFVLSNFGPIDDWTHFGATCAGIVYGFFTCPTLQLDDASSKVAQEEGIALVRRYADPCKSAIIFIIFIVVLSSLVFYLEPPLDTVEANSLE